MKKYAILLGVVLGLASVLSYAQAPVPFINLPLVPDATPPGGGGFTLTVNGTGFVPNSVVNWNSTPLATQFVSQSRVTATVPAADIATASTARVTVVSPAPGGGRSNVAFFAVADNAGKYIAFATSYLSAGSGPVAVAASEFSMDDNLDLAVVNYYDSYVSVLLGDGTGNFTQASSPGTVPYPLSVAVGDFNNDDKMDLAVAGGGVSVLLGDGTGNFTLASSPPVEGGYSLAVGDFNLDGKLDLAVANYGSGTVSILLGDGTGNFVLASSPPVGAGPEGVAVGDFNGDGKLDLAVANDDDNTVSILLGDGTGNFVPGVVLPVDSYPDPVAVGDFNGDGKLDLAVANGWSRTVLIFLGDGTGNFTLASRLSTSHGPISLALGDFNGDSKLDLAVTHWDWGDLVIFLGNGRGQFILGADLMPAHSTQGLALGDFNGDGKLDLVATNPDTYGRVAIVLQVPPSPAVSLSPNRLTFGTQVVGTMSNSQPVTLTNSGGARLDISSIGASANFIQNNNCGASLAPEASCTISVKFHPPRIDTVTSVITLRDNASDSPQAISLTGVGTLVALLPSSLNFGDQPVGTTSPPQTVTLTNHASATPTLTNQGSRSMTLTTHGADTVTVYSGQLWGPSATSFAMSDNTCLGQVPPGGSCRFNVTFTPTVGGPNTATLYVNDDGGGSPQTVTLIGNGT